MNILQEDSNTNSSNGDSANNGAVVSGGDGGEKSLDAFIKEVLADWGSLESWDLLGPQGP